MSRGIKNNGLLLWQVVQLGRAKKGSRTHGRLGVTTQCIVRMLSLSLWHQMLGIQFLWKRELR